jgi:hypothetical protein
VDPRWRYVAGFVLPLLACSLLLHVGPFGLLKWGLPGFVHGSGLSHSPGSLLAVAELAGLAYASLISRYWPVFRQVAFHVALMTATYIYMVVALPRAHEATGSALVYAAIWAAFILSANLALLPFWFSKTGHGTRNDPYFLLAAAYLAGALGAAAYPVLIEPFLRLRDQAWVWLGGYGSVVVYVAYEAVLFWKQKQPAAWKGADVREGPRSLLIARPATFGAPTMHRRLYWLAMATLPAMLAVASLVHLSVNVSPIPLVYVLIYGLGMVSLAISFGPTLHSQLLPLWTRGALQVVYGAGTLLLLAIVFLTRDPPFFTHLALFGFCALLPQRWIVVLLPISTLAVLAILRTEPTLPLRLEVLAHLFTLYVVARWCHGELACHRPDAEYLPELLLWLAAGGLAATLLLAFIAGFSEKIVEYPLTLTAALLLWLVRIVVALARQIALARPGPG